MQGLKAEAMALGDGLHFLANGGPAFGAHVHRQGQHHTGTLGFEQMPELLPLGRQVVGVVGAGVHHQRHPLLHLQAIAAEAGDLAGVVGEQPQPVDAEVGEDLCADAVVAQIRREAKPLIGFNGVEPGFLEAVGLQFVDQADAPPFLTQINDHSLAFRFDLAQGRLQLGTAVAAQ